MNKLIGAAVLAAAFAAAGPAFAVDAKQRVEDKAITVEAAWAVIGDFCGIGQWHPAVEKCALETRDGTEFRTLTLKGNGGTIVEKLVSRDDAKHSYTYEIVDPGPLPVANYQSTLSTKADDDGGAGIRWTGKFDAKGVSDDEAKAAIEGIYKAGLDAILAKAKSGS